MSIDDTIEYVACQQRGKYLTVNSDKGYFFFIRRRLFLIICIILAVPLKSRLLYVTIKILLQIYLSIGVRINLINFYFSSYFLVILKCLS